MAIKPTEKRKEGFGDNDVKATLALRKIFVSPESLDNRLSWELIYYVNPNIIEYIKRKNVTRFSIPETQLINEVLKLANQEAKFAIKGNSGHAISVTKKLMDVIVNSL